MDWMEITVTVSSEGEEAVTDIFYRLGCQGVFVEDPQLLKRYIDSGKWDYHSFEKAEETGRCLVKGYFPEDERLKERLVLLREELSRLKGIFPNWVLNFETVMVKEEDWANNWKDYFKPFRIGKRFLVKPTWEKAAYPEGVLVIEIDPGAAFGTGTHPTTALCLKALEEFIRPEQLVFDIGTGSGILSVAAALLGAEVQASDIDPLAVKIAAENVRINRVENKVSIKTGNLGEVFTGQADVVIANIIADVIIELLPQLSFLLKPGGFFLASGIIESRTKEVEAKIKEAGLELAGRREDSGWVLLIGRRR